MRNIILILLFVQLYHAQAFGQTTKNKYSLKLSSGRVSFGTGDVPGFAVGLEAAKNIIKTPKPGLNKLLFGAELMFENGVRQPKVNNISIEDFLTIYYHTSNTLLNPKITYHPFSGFIGGFNIAVGPSLGYSFQSREWQATRRQLPDGLYYRSSFLEYNNGWLVGYRISTGIEVTLSPKFLTGARMDFSSYSNGDINTLVALKLGTRW